MRGGATTSHCPPTGKGPAPPSVSDWVYWVRVSSRACGRRTRQCRAVAGRLLLVVGGSACRPQRLLSTAAYPALRGNARAGAGSCFLLRWLVPPAASGLWGRATGSPQPSSTPWRSGGGLGADRVWHSRGGAGGGPARGLLRGGRNVEMKSDASVLWAAWEGVARGGAGGPARGLLRAGRYSVTVMKLLSICFYGLLG